MNSRPVDLKNRMVYEGGEQAKDACTSCPDLIRCFEKLEMVFNLEVVAAVIALPRRTRPARPNMLRMLRTEAIFRSNLSFEAKPMVNISSKVRSFKVRNKLSRVGEVLVTERTDNPYGDWIVAHLSNNIRLRKTVVQGVL